MSGGRQMGVGFVAAVLSAMGPVYGKASREFMRRARSAARATYQARSHANLRECERRKRQMARGIICAGDWYAWKAAREAARPRVELMALHGAPEAAFEQAAREWFA